MPEGLLVHIHTLCSAQRNYDDGNRGAAIVSKNFSFAGAHRETIERAVYTLYGGLAGGFGVEAMRRLDALTRRNLFHSLLCQR